MAQNIYDDARVLHAYSSLPRSERGLAAAPEWPSLQALLPPVAGRRVVDLGCGFGYFCQWARDQGAASVLGIDLSERMLDRAAQHAGDRLALERQDLDALRLPSQQFDIAYSSLTLHYLTDLDHFMSTVHQSLVAGGHFVFSIEHPIYTAPSSPRFVADEAGRHTWPLDQYLLEGPRVTDWLAPEVVKQHRTIGTYVNTLVAAGFQIAGLAEWGPTPDQIELAPDWALERERPPFLLVSALA